jgi:hypothetical protein
VSACKELAKKKASAAPLSATIANIGLAPTTWKTPRVNTQETPTKAGAPKTICNFADIELTIDDAFGVRIKTNTRGNATSLVYYRNRVKLWRMGKESPGIIYEVSDRGGQRLKYSAETHDTSTIEVEQIDERGNGDSLETKYL